LQQINEATKMNDKQYQQHKIFVKKIEHLTHAEARELLFTEFSSDNVVRGHCLESLQLRKPTFMKRDN